MREVHPEEIRERKRMNSSDPETQPYELVALSEDGDELYRTESRDNENAILKAAERANDSLEEDPMEYEGTQVAEFLPVETGTMDVVEE